ncbi:MAG TPA: heparan-alpha-glucosaminide N-acetyltransferase domain-containing protein [Mucilaginibacter sp.]|nr:heparan-alpha-glucosaminide N-acetyltransferase domain-containing protein [Mucilaginibacter sp.]
MTTTVPVLKYRIESIDILRGLVMLIMAIDHSRDLFHMGTPEPTDLAITTPFFFFTRWITHFCAPAFVFLSGVSAYLAGMRRTENQLGIFLIKRGLWLLVVEVLLITLAITGNPKYNVLVLQVIWAIGGSMILLGLLIMLRVPLKAIGIIGAIIFFAHNLLDLETVKSALGSVTNTVAWKMLFSAAGFNGLVQIDSNHFVLIAYALIPWTGVMFVGYTFGTLYKSTVDAAKRKKTLLYSGLGLLALFLVFRYFNIYGDPAPWAPQKTTALSIISFFNVSKYPCSLLYLGMTIGASLVILSQIENIKNKFTSIMIVYGNVPFFYYLCHWYLLRIITIIVFFASGYKTSEIVTPQSPFLFAPKGYGFNLFGVYVVWFIVIAILYLPCRWFSKYKKTHQQWWLSYL